MRRRGDGDHVDVLPFQHAAEVGVFGLVVRAVEPLHVALGELRHANANALKAFDQLAVGAGAAAADADERGADGVAGRNLPARPGHGAARLFQRKHMQDMVRVGNKLPHYDMVSTIGIVRDVPDYLTDLIGSLEHFANGVKPMVLLCSDEHKFDDVLRMFETLHDGDLGEKPFIIPYFNPVSPLVMNQGTVDKMKIAIERGLPVIISNYSLSGATTPITPAGTVAVLLAELLAGSGDWTVI